MSSQSSDPVADLAYVAGAVRRRAVSPIPLSIAALWATFVLIGYVWVDFRPQTCWIFFAAAGPLGGAASWWLGRRAAARAGEFDPAEDRRVLAHFLSIFVAGLFVVAMAATGQIDGGVMGQLLALVSGVVYFLAGAHYNPRFYWLGAVLMAGAVAVGLVPAYGWTALGVLMAIALIGAAVVPVRKS